MVVNELACRDKSHFTLGEASKTADWWNDDII